MSSRLSYLLLTFSLLGLELTIAAPPATGSITRHSWTGVSGTAVSNLTSLAAYPDSPDATTTDTSFHSPTNTSDNFGTRMFGWVHAPVTGDYTFWIHSDDNGELWLSTSESPDDRQLIASVPEWTNDGEWDKFTEQQSTTISLVAGEYYFIEALMKEETGGDNLGVAWSYPGQAQTYIPGSSLSPWQNLDPEAEDDTMILAPGSMVAIPVLDNDLEPNGSDDFDFSTLEVISGPSDGTTSIDSTYGRVIYEHTGTGTGIDTFTYRIRDLAGVETTATVDITLSDDLRLPNTTIRMPDAPPVESLGMEPAFDLTFNQPLDIASLPGDTTRLWVTEKGGDLEIIPDVTAATPTKSIFLNVDSVVNLRSGENFLTGSEQGLLGVAFHPNYASNGYFFTVYNVSVSGLAHQRLSRWTDSNPADDTAAGATEHVLIQMRNEQGNHNGGDLEFGPDGYLYMSWGDEGGANDVEDNSQLIDADFWSSITRIDVDLEPEDYTVDDGTGSDDDNLAPNSHAAVVLHSEPGFVAPSPLYEVPDDNFWVGATSFNGVGVNASDVRTEFFAVGLRNPWRFGFDSLTGDLWCADVGQSNSTAREEVLIIENGSNHGWAWREGTSTGPKSGDVINGAIEANATLSDPEYFYLHGNEEFEGDSITGGVVYRGDMIPSLYGKYIFADYISGNIWSLQQTETPGSPVVERILGEGGVVGFGTDPSNGDVLIADYDGRIHRIVSNGFDNDFPVTLSETGIFADTENRIPNPGLVAYDANVPFWSDYAIKQRWFSILNTSDTFTFQEDGAWTTPEGAIWVKHFEMLQDDSDPNSGFPLETRVLVRNASGVYGVSYRWNPAGTEATLVGDAGDTFSISVTAGGMTRNQNWNIPSRANCISCHKSAAGHVLSFNTRQLNRDGQIASSLGNFISLMSAAGYLSNVPPDPDTLPIHVSPDATEYSLEARVRSYLDINCAYCHRPGGGVAGFPFDARHELTLDQTKLIEGTLNNPEDPADRLVIPANPPHSAVLSRVAETNGYSRMPPIGSNELDHTAIALLTDWINQEASTDTTYNDWRITNFGNDTSSQGDPTADPDGDGDDNEREWLTDTDPNDINSRWSLSLELSGGQTSIGYPGIRNGSVRIEHSTNLIDWSLWDATGNDGVPRNPNSPALLMAPTTDSTGFFRADIEER
ncbi:PQQ-dependent sugar dehydrogenase [Haloferula sp.]|uniref:PQQ-dependent sugar dehydrogenase n=1 Tax=Haloferula sp. TaxID=2497595 RepID=UPI00329FC759